MWDWKLNNVYTFQPKIHQDLGKTVWLLDSVLPTKISGKHTRILFLKNIFTTGSVYVWGHGKHWEKAPWDQSPFYIIWIVLTKPMVMPDYTHLHVYEIWVT